MPYIENRLVHDADSHLMEMSDCLNPYFEKSLLGRFLEHPNLGVRVGNRLAMEEAQKRQEDEIFRAAAGENIMLRKNYDAQGPSLRMTARRLSIISGWPVSWCSPPSAWATSASTSLAIWTCAMAQRLRTIA